MTLYRVRLVADMDLEFEADDECAAIEQMVDQLDFEVEEIEPEEDDGRCYCGRCMDCLGMTNSDFMYP